MRGYAARLGEWCTSRRGFHHIPFDCIRSVPLIVTAAPAIPVAAAHSPGMLTNPVVVTNFPPIVMPMTANSNWRISLFARPDSGVGREWREGTLCPQIPIEITGT